MRRHVMAAVVLAAVVPRRRRGRHDAAGYDSSRLMESAPSSESAPAETGVVTESTAADGTIPAPTDTTEAPAVEPATIYDESGNRVATVTVTGAELAWTDYEEGNDPESGREYVRVTVSVESLITEGTFGVAIDDFILQDNDGFVTTANNVPTAAQAEADDEITEEADLASGESVELALTFEVNSNVGPQLVFYRPTTSASLTSLNSAELRSPFAWCSRPPGRCAGQRHVRPALATMRRNIGIARRGWGCSPERGTGSTTAMRADGRMPGLPEPLGCRMTRRQQVAAANHASRTR